MEPIIITFIQPTFSMHFIDPEGAVGADGPPAEDQRVPGAQDSGAERVRQDDPGDRGTLCLIGYLESIVN